MLTFELVAQYITIVIIDSMLMANFMSIFLTPSVAENHHRGTNSESSAKISFLLLHPLDRLAKLCQSLTVILCKTAAL